MKDDKRWDAPKFLQMARSTQRGREGWRAIYEVKGKRVVGSLIQDMSEIRPSGRGRLRTPSRLVLPADARLVRDHFNVALKKDGTFAVDIGTGSGVKIHFSTRKQETPVEAITRKIGERFHTFGGGRTPTPGNPIAAALKDRPLIFAAGVDVADVVRFVLEEAKQ